MLHFSILSIVISIISLAVAHPCVHSHTITQSHRSKILDNYVKIWNGDLSIINETFAPHLTLQVDRYPAGKHGSIAIGPTVKTSAAFEAFVEKTRSNFKEYSIVPRMWVGEGRGIAVRWAMEGVIGDHFALPTTLKPGERVTYNGTEYLMLDPCTGIIEEVDSAQDLITYLYNLGNNINLTPRKTT